MGAALALAAAACAVAVALLQFQQGIPPTGYYHAYDESFAIGALHGFRAALARGDWFPDWISTGNAGLGSPVFCFYPPAAYYVGSLVAALAGPRLSDADVIGLAIALYRVLDIAAAYLWLRRWTTPAAALLGGAAFALMPEIAFLEPMLMGGYAQMAAAPLLALLFWAVDRGEGRPVRLVAFVAPVVAGLALTHLPLTVAGGGLAVVYALLSARGGRVAAAAGAAVAVGLGIGIAAVTVLTAMLLQPETNMIRAIVPPEKLEFLFAFAAFGQVKWWRGLLFGHFIALMPMGMAALGWWLAARPVPRQAPVLGTAAVALFLVTPLSRPLWEHLPLLARIQFPTRFLSPVSLLAAGGFAMGVARMRPAVAAVLAGLLLPWSVVLVVESRVVGAHGAAGAARTASALADSWVNVPMYLPAASLVHEWETPRLAGPGAMAEEAARLTGCAARHGLAAVHLRRAVSVDVAGCEGPTVLPQFYFPGWETPQGWPPPRPDAATGLVVVDVPAGTKAVVLRRATLPGRAMAAAVSLVSLLIWLAAALRARSTGTPPRRWASSSAG